MTAPTAAPDLLRSILGNTASLVAGRLLVTGLRFVVALMIVRTAGLERFGEFALISSFILIADWLTDFGLADIAAREMATRHERNNATFSAFTVLKAIQGPVAALAMAVALPLLDHPPGIVRAGFMATGAVLLYAGVQVFRLEFRHTMRMARDVAAELVAALVLLMAVWYAVRREASVEMLTLCLVFSRACQFAMAACLSARRTRLEFGPAFRSDFRILLTASVPLGLTGLVVGAYDAVDAVALARWSTHDEVGAFSIVLRMVMLAIIAIQALAMVTLPLLSSLWTRDRELFTRTLQCVMDWGMLIAGTLLCGLYAGAGALSSMTAREPAAISAVLQLMVWAILARTVVTLVSPLVIIAGRLQRTIWIATLVLTAKVLALYFTAQAGAVGAAAAYLIAEVGVGLVPTVILCQQAASVRLNWSVPLKLTMLATVLAFGVDALPLPEPLRGLLAPTLFLTLATSLRIVRLRPLRELVELIHRRRGTNG